MSIGFPSKLIYTFSSAYLYPNRCLLICPQCWGVGGSSWSVSAAATVSQRSRWFCPSRISEDRYKGFLGGFPWGSQYNQWPGYGFDQHLSWHGEVFGFLLTGNPPSNSKFDRNGSDGSSACPLLTSIDNSTIEMFCTPGKWDWQGQTGGLFPRHTWHLKPMICCIFSGSSPNASAWYHSTMEEKLCN